MTMKNYNHGRSILISSTFTSKFNVSRSRSFFFIYGGLMSIVSNFTYSPDYHSVNLTFYFKFEFCRACIVSLQTVMQIA